MILSSPQNLGILPVSKFDVMNSVTVSVFFGTPSELSAKKGVSDLGS